MVDFSELAVKIPSVLLPAAKFDPQKWSVIACDQYTSNRKYWEDVHNFIGDSPSTLDLILPEVYLEDPEVNRLIKKVNTNMISYLTKKILTPLEPGFILIDRQTPHVQSRKGLLLAVDLEKYDYRPGSKSLIRSTEETITDRLPPRIKIRQGGCLELPHIMLLLDDPGRSVIEPLFKHLLELPKIYDFDLMMNSGRLTGYHLKDPALEEQVFKALANLADPTINYEKYGVKDEVLLFAVGDGNHSLATAKAIWEEIKSKATDPSELEEHPARYCLVEVVNLYDEGLFFHPIHRVLFNVNTDLFFGQLQAHDHCQIKYSPAPSLEALPDNTQCFCFFTNTASGVVTINNPSSNLTVGSLQTFLDDFLQRNPQTKIDYVHGEQETKELGCRPGNIGFLLPSMDKQDLFKTVIIDGALPRKTFSMGEADEKRFYMEARKICP
ncbi:MAG TPA: DUF1015 domain-containing protein [Firmicutes bacterium]|jgi:hypothetical protein|nr:DUF1015 domain-containing protein [Bacillota bacterium]HBK69861.1 DUF1015 domain-containing protein [Bacillota bacterium]